MSWVVGKRMIKVSKLDKFTRVWYIEGSTYLKFCIVRRMWEKWRSKVSRIKFRDVVKGCINLPMSLDMIVRCELVRYRLTRTLSLIFIKIEFWLQWQTERYEFFWILHGIRFLKLWYMTWDLCTRWHIVMHGY